MYKWNKFITHRVEVNLHAKYTNVGCYTLDWISSENRFLSWRELSSGIQCRAAHWKLTDFLEEHITSIFRVEQDAGSHWYLARPIRPWRWRWYVPPKLRRTSSGLHSCENLKSYISLVLFSFLTLSFPSFHPYPLSPPWPLVFSFSLTFLTILNQYPILNEDPHWFAEFWYSILQYCLCLHKGHSLV
jgi:hypothetical protein